MRTMANLVSDILNMNSEDLEMLAQGLVWFSSNPSNQAEKLAFLLETHIREHQGSALKELESQETL